MTGTIKVSPDKLIATADEFKTEGDTMNSLVSQMINMVTSMSSTWEGDASTAYTTKFKGLEADLQMLNRMITEHVSDLTQMANLYKSAEQANADDAASLTAGVIV